MNFSLAYVDMLSKLELCYVAVWGKSLLSTHMLVGSSNSNAVYMCVKVLFGAHDIKER